MRLPDPARSRLVLIGTGAYRSADLPDVPVIATNIRDMQAALTCIKPEHRVVVPPHANAELVGELLTTAAREAHDTLIVYYAGHGLLSPRGLELYLTLAGTEPARLAFSALRFEAVREAFLDSPARNRIAILDCCYSGRAIGTPLAAAGHEVLGQLVVEGSYILTSSPGTRTSVVLPGEPHTAFTHRFLQLLSEGIPGGPELLTLRAIYHHLLQALARENLPPPQQSGTATADTLALATNRWTPATPARSSRHTDHTTGGASAAPAPSRAAKRKASPPPPASLEPAPPSVASLRSAPLLPAASGRAAPRGGNLATEETLRLPFTDVQSAIRAGIPDDADAEALIQCAQTDTVGAYRLLRREPMSPFAPALIEGLRRRQVRYPGDNQFRIPTADRPATQWTQQASQLLRHHTGEDARAELMTAVIAPGGVLHDPRDLDAAAQWVTDLGLPRERYPQYYPADLIRAIAADEDPPAYIQQGVRHSPDPEQLLDYAAALLQQSAPRKAAWLMLLVDDVLRESVSAETTARRIAGRLLGTWPETEQPAYWAAVVQAYPLGAITDQQRARMFDAGTSALYHNRREPLVSTELYNLQRTVGSQSVIPIEPERASGDEPDHRHVRGAAPAADVTPNPAPERPADAIRSKPAVNAPHRRTSSSDDRTLIMLMLFMTGGLVAFCGLGMNQTFVVAFGIVIAVAGPVMIMVLNSRKRVRLYVHGTAVVEDVTARPAQEGRSARGRLRLTITAVGIRGITVTGIDPAIPLEKWPERGAVLPVQVLKGNPRKFSILWDRVQAL
ncbi:caspase, EACC1-associated type [Dactylosporangium matsuzakiense]|uniref:Peptidase C14 caspase domain-containing protein n=1 Tax=Dactylosporangium matsuzakiense TaxID=53360 RepID=A0A9W6KPX3_9ACTN|nr:caspase family protein [Dactylosporangium matsuzakiense]UWZ44607.1 hypothetical protein Dmats_45950 [Dactylosporangium matsuzakiense]GLL05378.1 hypothetical protein GCM10017581_071250 [Dactylosporangium matsuzakiense]